MVSAHKMVSVTLAHVLGFNNFKLQISVEIIPYALYGHLTFPIYDIYRIHIMVNVAHFYHKPIVLQLQNNIGLTNRYITTYTAVFVGSPRNYSPIIMLIIVINS